MPPRFCRIMSAVIQLACACCGSLPKFRAEAWGVRIWEPSTKAMAEPWDQPKGSGMSQKLGTVAHIGDVLHTLGLPVDFAAAADDERWDAELDAETQLALSRTGRDVGTPIITFAPRWGVLLAR